MSDEKLYPPAALASSLGPTSEPISLRDYFAGQILSGLIVEDKIATAPSVAAWVYRLADAMLAEREKE